MHTKNRILVGIGLTALFMLACSISGAPAATPAPTPEPSPMPPETVVLAWSRTGGIAGFCDQLTITADGRAVATTCASAFMPDPAPLDPADWAQLQAWLDAYGPYKDMMSDDAVADSMTVTLEFYGHGPGEAGEMEMDSLLNFAARVFDEMHEP